MGIDVLDLGQGFSLRFTGWYPDRELNPQYDHLANVPKMGAVVTCRHNTEGSILFDHGFEYAHLFPNHPKWRVTTWEPLSISPSIQKKNCNCHGYIIDGKWVDC